LEFLNAQPGKPAAAAEKPPASASKEVPVGGKDEWVSEKSSENFRNEFITLLRAPSPPSNEHIVVFIQVSRKRSRTIDE
jgi:hypothetical protein